MVLVFYLEFGDRQRHNQRQIGILAQSAGSKPFAFQANSFQQGLPPGTVLQGTGSGRMFLCCRSPDRQVPRSGTGELNALCAAIAGSGSASGCTTSLGRGLGSGPSRGRGPGIPSFATGANQADANFFTLRDRRRVSALDRSYCSCCRNQLSAVVSNAIESRIAPRLRR